MGMDGRKNEVINGGREGGKEVQMCLGNFELVFLFACVD